MLNPASPLPLYHQLAELLSSRIARGELQPGARLPSEPELSRTHRIGRPTVRQATELLVQRGLIERRRGSGTYVRSAARRVDLFSLAGTLESFQAGGI
ncbi:MAG TPA: GntR family transcriptional regulator, partial [Polyangiaceae bacterium]|nr:GntR family transcriptional regulator [Polyangiaceae bacterium]